MKTPRFITTLLLLTIVGLTGCTSFETQWRDATAPSGLPGDLTGSWTGTWQNTNNDHGGALRALVTRINETNYSARFHATWGSHSGSFRTKLKGRQEGDEFAFEGRKRIMGFLITTRGRANATNFFSTYESRFDNGTFTLGRP